MPPKPHNDIEKITDKAVRDICSVAVAPAAKSKVRAIILSVIAEVLEEKAQAIEKMKKHIDKRYSTDEKRYPHGFNTALFLAQQIIRGTK